MDRGSPRAALAGVALGGVVLAHCLAYLMADPLATTRRAHMAATGHGAFPAVATLASAVAVSALVAACFQALASSSAWRIDRTAVALAAIQVPAFLLLESVERGLDLRAAMSDPAVRIGLVLQAVVALLAAFLIRGIERTVRVVAGRRPQRVVLEPPPRPAGLLVPARSQPFSSALRRAPPLPLGV